ncbi:Xylose isomerase-like TIM barrel [Phycisphaerae bacterium RAS1]|nr:Xylose isomerase-like TIM barrel [Phycisphaerae bacterium RAS1]
MSVRIAINAAAFGGQSLESVVASAKDAGAEGLELAAIHGSLDIGLMKAVVAAPGAARDGFSAAGVAPAILDTDLSVGVLDGSRLAHWLALAEKWIRLAGQIGGATILMRVDGGGLNRDVILRQAVEALNRLCGLAGEAGVTVLLENSGVAAASRELWFLQDAVGSASLRVCWNTALPLAAPQPVDPPTIALKRLAPSLAVVRLALERVVAEAAGQRRTEDGVFEPAVVAADEIDILHVVELLRGIAYSGWILLSPSAREADATPAAAPAADLSVATAYLRAQFAKPVIQMTAYKGDKNAPRYPRPATAS